MPLVGEVLRLVAGGDLHRTKQVEDTQLGAAMDPPNEPQSSVFQLA